MMDRQSGDLEREQDAGDTAVSAIALTDADEALVETSARRLAVPDRLLNLAELDVMYDEGARALWTFMRPAGRPSFTPSLLSDFESWQDLIGQHFGPGRVPLDYLILGSRSAGVFCFGGDLDLFQALIRTGDRAGLVRYGYRCIEILHRNLHALDLPLVTVGLVQGQALGGGFEALLSFDLLIAERGATFSLPEVMFGLFPGMGAHALLSRKLGTAMADRVILSNQVFSAEDMLAMGLVAQVVEPGQGIAAVREHMARTSRHHGGQVAARRAMRVASPVALAELRAIVDLWADAALGLREADLKLMSRLAATQARNYSAAA